MGKFTSKLINVTLTRDFTPSTSNVTTGTIVVSFKNTPIFSFKTLENSSKILEKGHYTLISSFSPKFNRHLFMVHGTTRKGIRIHSGNTVYDTKGCILVGNYLKGERLMESRKALEWLHLLLNKEYNYKILIK